MSRAIKRVLIEQAELDRMQQRQLREYSPELHSMAAMYRKSIDILYSKDLSDGEKLRQLYAIDPSFNQLKSQINTLGSKPAVTPSSESALDAEAAAAKKVTTSEQVATQAPGAQPASPASPLDIRLIKLEPNVRAKAANHLLKITTNLQVLSRNAAGALVLYSEPVVGSYFDAIFQAAFTGNSSTDLPGTDSFFRGLRTLRVSMNALSSRNFVKAYGSTPRRTKQGVLALDEEEEEEEGPSAKREREDDFKTPRRSEPPWSPPIRPLKSMRQSGHKLKKKPPLPGWRPNVLYVY